MTGQREQGPRTAEDREQSDVWAAELERRNEGDGHGNPQRHQPADAPTGPDDDPLSQAGRGDSESPYQRPNQEDAPA